MTISPLTIRATFELAPHGSAEALAIEESVGMPGGPDHVRGRVVSESDGRAVLDFPASNWGPNVPLLVSALVAGECVETAAFTRCRLVDIALPPAFLPGPAFGAAAGRAIGVIVKPSLGLTPAEVGEVAEAAAAGGASLIKDDELLGDPGWCPLEDRVKAVASVLPAGVTYCPNVTGPSATLIDRARRAVDLGATGVMVNAFAQGLDSVLSLRQAEIGVPIFAHRVASGPWVRNSDFGVSGAVLAALTRWCGGDFVLVGAYGGKLFDTEAEVDAQVVALRDGRCGVRPATVVLGGGLGPDNARAQADRAGGDGVLLLLGSAAYCGPESLEGAVRRAVEQVAE